MKKSVLLSLILVFIMLFPLIPVSSGAIAWDGMTAASEFIAGKGTETEPYILTDATELYKLSMDVFGGLDYAGTYFKLGADIDLGNQTWQPIGIKATPFAGNFDGDGYTVSGLTVKDKSLEYSGLFGYIKNGTIQNLKVSANTLYSSYFTGTLVAYVAVENSGDCKTIIQNCHVLKADLLTGATVGGLVGRADTSNAYNRIYIIGCTVDNVRIESPDKTDELYNFKNCKNCFFGGLVGATGAAIFNGCGVTNSRILMGFEKSTSTCAGGGLVAMHGASSTPTEFYNCYVFNIELSNSAELTTVNDKNTLGGFAGRCAHVLGSVIKNCYAAKVSIVNNCGSSAFVGYSFGYIPNIPEFGNCLNFSAGEQFGADYNTEFTPVEVIDGTKLNDAGTLAKLNEGNSKTVWVAGEFGYPVIDLAALLENENTTASYLPPEPETTPKPATTKSPETTKSPATTTAPATSAPAVTETPQDETTAAPKASGCGSAASVGICLVVTLLGCAVVKRKIE